MNVNVSVLCVCCVFVHAFTQFALLANHLLCGIRTIWYCCNFLNVLFENWNKFFLLFDLRLLV